MSKAVFDYVFFDELPFDYSEVSLAPDGQVAWINLDDSYLAVQDDPDNPDALWGDAIETNADTLAHVTFPNPTGNPTQGVDLQEFKVLVKKAGGSTTPQCRIDLYEGGVLRVTGTATDVTSTTGQLKSFTWDAVNLSTTDGSLVEAYVYGIKAAGGPSTRSTVSVGAVEWNVTYSEVPIPNAFNKILYTSEPPTPNAWNQVKQEAGTGWRKLLYT